MDNEVSEKVESEVSEKVEEISQDAKNIAIMTWVGSIFLGFIPGLVFYLTKKDDAYIFDQAKEALNWSITAILGYCLAMVLSIIVIGVFLIPVIGLCHLVFCIMGALATADGKEFRVPFALRLLK